MPVPPTVLVVDDEPSIRLLCRINLELEGYHVVEAGTLGEARDAVESHDVSVVLLDLHLRHESGRALLEDLGAASRRCLSRSSPAPPSCTRRATKAPTPRS